MTEKYYCGQCKYFTNFYCPKRNRQISYSSYTCSDFKLNTIEYYQKGMFSVEDKLFYENNKRLGYFEDEEKEEILQNNHEKTVDRLNELRELNIELKRNNKQLRKENKEILKFKDKVFQLLSYYIQDIKENNKYGDDCCRINQVELLRTLEKELKK